MKSYPSANDILAEIGEKSVQAFSRSVTKARRDLRVYRQAFPDWVAEHSERGLANWISDRLWAHLSAIADSISDMVVTETGPLREITIGVNYRFRVKRHSYEGSIASYPTPTFLEWVEQPQGLLPGMEERRLIAGYDWDKDLRDIGDPVISLRDGKDNVIWKESLPEVDDQEEGGGAQVIAPEQPGPTSPQVDVPEAIGQKPEEPTEPE